MATIDLSVPARPELLHLVRFHVGAAAAYADFRLEAVEDLQLAVDELCLSLLNQLIREDRRLKVTVSWVPSGVEVVCTVDADLTSHLGHSVASTNGRADRPGPLATLPADLSARVLDALVDEHGTFSEPGCLGAWLRKRQVLTGQPRLRRPL